MSLPTGEALAVGDFATIMTAGQSMKTWAMAVMLGLSVSAATARDDADTKDAGAVAVPGGAGTQAEAVTTEGNPSAGADKVAVCAACHGAGGVEPLTPIYPHLAGQSVEYLESSLLAYRDGLRQGGMGSMMAPQARNLSAQDIKDIAAHCHAQSFDPGEDALAE